MCPELEYHLTIKKTLISIESVIGFQSNNKDNLNQKLTFDSFNAANYFQSIFELQELLNKLNKNCYFKFLYNNNLV